MNFKSNLDLNKMSILYCKKAVLKTLYISLFPESTMPKKNKDISKMVMEYFERLGYECVRNGNDMYVGIEINSSIMVKDLKPQSLISLCMYNCFSEEPYLVPFDFMDMNY